MELSGTHGLDKQSEEVRAAEAYPRALLLDSTARLHWRNSLSLLPFGFLFIGHFYRAASVGVEALIVKAWIFPGFISSESNL